MNKYYFSSKRIDPKKKSCVYLAGPPADSGMCSLNGREKIRPRKATSHYGTLRSTCKSFTKETIRLESRGSNSPSMLCIDIAAVVLCAVIREPLCMHCYGIIFIYVH